MPVTPEPSWRKPAGIAILLLLIAAWAVAVVMLVEALRLPEWASAVAFIVGGLAWLWALPTKRLLRWMELGSWRY
jgi:membrane protein YdbS with pleckstrin-like domain